MKKPNPDIEQAKHELQFAQQQVQSGQRALNNQNIDPKVAERVKTAVDYWQKQTTIAQQRLDMVRSTDGKPQQGKR